MFKKIIAGFLVLATSTLFGMSLSKLNSASKAELMEINGIGEVKAAAIIKERRHGKFKSFDDLSSRVEGVGEQTAANIKNDVKVGEKVKKVKKRTAKKSTKRKSSSTKETTSKKSKKETAKKSKKKSESKKDKAKKAEKALKKKKKKTKKEKSKKTKKSKKSKKAA